MLTIVLSVVSVARLIVLSVVSATAAEEETLLKAKALLTEMIAMAATAANTNFFIVLLFYLMFIVVNSLVSTLVMLQRLCQNSDYEYTLLNVNRLVTLRKNVRVWKVWKWCGKIPQSVVETMSVGPLQVTCQSSIPYFLSLL